jgi:arginyl-tRNA synthetase
MNIFNSFLDQVKAGILSHFQKQLDLSAVVVEIPKEKAMGDLSFNFAMVLSKQLGMKPRDIADAIIPLISSIKGVEKCEIAGPGFVNVFLSVKFWIDLVPAINQAASDYAKSNLGGGKKINVEFVSANPTGPMHIGHSRGAVYGDCLVRLLKFAGYDVTAEYYINDAGGQINTLALSVWIRYLETLGEDVTIPEGCYPGEYLIAVGEKLKEKYGTSLKSMGEVAAIPVIKEFAVTEMMQLIKEDLAMLNVHHDSFVSEYKDVVLKGYNEKAFSLLKEKGLIYRGILEAPKGKTPDDWEPREQDLFKATAFGDDVDRPLKKSDGSFTYFATDIAYHLYKIERGFDELVLSLGADHAGYIKRIKAVVKALSDDKVKLDVKINQLVNLLKDGEPYKMSKRAGNFVTVADMVDEVGTDIIRFIMLLRKNDTILDFDFSKAKEQTKDNPVFYVQYAYARAHSVLRKLNADIVLDNINYSLIKDPAEINLIKAIALLPKIVESAVLTHEPHRIVNYLQDLAHAFHTLWAKGNEDESLRFIVESDDEVTKARIALVKAFLLAADQALFLVGIKGVERM